METVNKKQLKYCTMIMDFYNHGDQLLWNKIKTEKSIARLSTIWDNQRKRKQQGKQKSGLSSL